MLHGQIGLDGQCWEDGTEAEARKQAKRLSLSHLWGVATIIRTKHPEKEHAECYFIEQEPGMIRLWESVVATYRDGKDTK